MGTREFPLVGILGTCSPVRPNPVLMTVVRLCGRKENVLEVTGLDAVDGTPVVDIKPYVKSFFPQEGGLIPEWMRQIVSEMEAMVADITESLPVEDDSVDLCFLATVMHTLDLAKDVRRLFSEIDRVVKPGGRVAIIECKKEDQPFGPPKHVRLSPEQIGCLARPYGVEKVGLVDLGYNYLSSFVLNEADIYGSAQGLTNSCDRCIPGDRSP